MKRPERDANFLPQLVRTLRIIGSINPHNCVPFGVQRDNLCLDKFYEIQQYQLTHTRNVMTRAYSRSHPLADPSFQLANL